jgi:hypothetical protein
VFLTAFCHFKIRFSSEFQCFPNFFKFRRTDTLVSTSHWRPLQSDDYTYGDVLWFFLDPLMMQLIADLFALSSIDSLNCRIMNNGDVNFKFSEFWKKRWISTAHCGFNVSSQSKYTMIWANIEARGSIRCPDSDESSSITCLIECKNKVSVRQNFWVDHVLQSHCRGLVTTVTKSFCYRL